MNNLNYDVDDGNLPQNIKIDPSTAMGSSKKLSGADKTEPAAKIRKPRPKLDFNRLLRGNRGLGYLAVCTKKSLKLSGKPGHEAQDLSQIVVYLQEWAKLVFPKMPLVEFLLKVEDICQSRIMKACVPEIMARIKEMGENVDLKDFEGVETEIMARLAANQAEKALNGVDRSSESKRISTNESDDFNLDEELMQRRQEYTDNESEIDSENEDDLGNNEELKDFINDDDDGEEEEQRNNFQKREIPFSFSDSDNETSNLTSHSRPRSHALIQESDSE